MPIDEKLLFIFKQQKKELDKEYEELLKKLSLAQTEEEIQSLKIKLTILLAKYDELEQKLRM